MGVLIDKINDTQLYDKAKEEAMSIKESGNRGSIEKVSQPRKFLVTIIILEHLLIWARASGVETILNSIPQSHFVVIATNFGIYTEMMIILNISVIAADLMPTLQRHVSYVIDVIKTQRKK